MLVYDHRLLNVPIMSLQTGARLANTAKPIIDPANLRIVAYEVEGPLLHERPAFLRTNDIREMGKIGIIINGNDDFVGLDDVIQIKDLYHLRFQLIGFKVVDEHKRHLGKVNAYTVDTMNFLIQQLDVRQGFIKGIADTGRLVHRSQIIEINNSFIIVKSPSIKVEQPVMEAVRGEFVNPFRSPKPQPSPESMSET